LGEVPARYDTSSPILSSPRRGGRS
jgi:hypothetical protein